MKNANEFNFRLSILRSIRLYLTNETLLGFNRESKSLSDILDTVEARLKQEKKERG